MRYYFLSEARVKKAAMRMSAILIDPTLSRIQQAIAKALGYRDFYDFQGHYSDESPSLLNEELPEPEFRARSVELILSIARYLDISDSDVQYALSFSRLTGNREFSLGDHEAIRCVCWRRTSMPWKGPRIAGAVVSTNISDRRHAYLRRNRVSGGSAMCVTDMSIDSCFADFEVSSPRTRAADFVPRRLYLPYGCWKTKSGSTFIFSRNYKPLWELSASGVIKRALPWKWIDNIEVENWFGGSHHAETTWHENLKSGAGEEILRAYEISGLPLLVDVLPIVLENDLSSLDTAVGMLKRKRSATDLAA